MVPDPLPTAVYVRAVVALSSGRRCTQRRFAGSGVLVSGVGIFAIELEMLARRTFMDIDTLIQLQMVQARFIDGQAECALHRHLDSLGPNTPMADIVDCCLVWESHREVEIEPRKSADRRPVRDLSGNGRRNGTCCIAGDGDLGEHC